jgi:GAF domain-containing protein
MLDRLEKPDQNTTMKRLQSLYELSERMNSVYELPELLDFVVDRTLSLTGGQQGLLLLSDDQEELTLDHVAVVRGQAHHDREPLKLVSTSVINDTLARGEPRLVVDLQVDERYTRLTSSATQQLKRVRSVLAVPLKIEAQLVGLIYIDHPKRAYFGQADLDFLRAFANQAAVAIHRAREHQRQIDELTLLNMLSRSVVQVLDLDEVLTRIIQETNRMLGVETGSVLLWDEASAELFFATAISNGQRINISTRLKLGQGIAGWVASTGQAVRINNVAQDPRWYGEVEVGFTFETRSVICVPLQIQGRVVGVIEVFNKKGSDGFNTRDMARLSAFANSATIAIENARLYEQARQVDHLRALNELSLALSSSLEIKTIINTGLAQARSLLRAEASAICFRDGPAELPPLQVSRGGLSPLANQASQQLAELSHLTTLLLDRNGDDPLLIDTRHPPAELALPALAATGLNGIALVPIKVSDVISGALLVLQQTAPPYNRDDIGLLVSIARIMGLAVQNAIHYHQLRAQTLRLTYLSEIGTALTGSLDLKHILQVIIEGVNSLLETERTSVFLIDPDSHELVLSHTNEGDANIRLPAPWQGIAGWVATHDQPALVNDTMSDPRHLHQITQTTGYQAHSILCVPLKVEDQVIGVVEVLNKTSNQQFTLAHQSLLTELTRWAAIAIHNARLFNERIQAYQRLASEQERRIAAETRGAMASVILDMAHTMNNIVGAIRVWAKSLEQAVDLNPTDPLVKYETEMNQIRENAEEAIRLISNMTDPLKQATIAPTDIHECLNQAIQSCWWPETIQLHKNYGLAVPLVQANAKRLQAAFHNLFSNAVQALAKSGGRIEVQTRRTDKGWSEVRISDNGPGIPPEIQKNIFNPQVSSHSEGLGIGLWLTETFINQFGGTIDFITSPETGTTFIITLQPAGTPDAAPAQDDPKLLKEVTQS